MINVKAFCLSLTGFSSFSAHSLQLKNPGTLTVCSYSEFQPVSYGKGEGYEADLLKAIAKMWDIPIQFYSDNIYEGLWRHPSREYTCCDLSIGGFTASKERILENTIFSNPTDSFKQSLLIRREDYESGRILSYESFLNSDMKIGVVPGTTGEQYARVVAETHGLSDKVFFAMLSEKELLLALKDNRIDAIARGEIGNLYQEHLDSTLMTIARRDFKEAFSIAVNSENAELLLKLNEAIAFLTENGAITVDQWLKKPEIFMGHVCEIQK